MSFRFMATEYEAQTYPLDKLLVVTNRLTYKNNIIGYRVMDLKTKERQIMSRKQAYSILTDKKRDKVFINLYIVPAKLKYSRGQYILCVDTKRNSGYSANHLHAKTMMPDELFRQILEEDETFNVEKALIKDKLI